MRFFRKIFILLLIISFPFRSFAVSSLQKKSDFQIVAKVNNEAITQYDLNNRYKLIYLFNKRNKKLKLTKNLVYKQALDQLIEEKIKEQEVLEKKVEINSDEVSDYIYSIGRKNGFYKNGLKKYLVSNGIDYNQYLKKITNDLKWNKLIKNNIEPNIIVYNYEVDEVVEYLVENPDRIRFNVSEIFIPLHKPKNKKEIAIFVDDIYREIKENNNFEEMAGKFSRSSTAENFGNIGWLDENDLDETIFKNISNLRKGDVSKPFFLDNGLINGYYIFKLNDKKKERIIKETEIDRVKAVIYRQKLDIEIKNYLNKLYSNAFVEILNDTGF